MGWSLAGSYGDWYNSDLAKTGGSLADGTTYWSAGVAYEVGPFGASVTYLDSTYDTVIKDNKFQNIVFGIDYKLAPGLTPYAELSLYDENAANTVANKGSVGLIGTQLSF
jgi:predicted porin